MSDVNEWSAVEDGNTHLDQYDLEKQINPHSQLNRYTKKIMAAVRAKTDAMQAEIDTLAPTSGVVHIDGDETVDGVKTFTEPIVGDVSVTLPASGGVTPVPRTLTERFGDVVNVKDFGAVGDGEVDDTGAITKAFAAGAGKCIYFPKGTYFCTAGFTVSSDTSVVGDNATLTLEDYVRFGPHGISGVGVSNVYISGLFFRKYDCGIRIAMSSVLSAYPATDSNCIKNIVIENCRFDNERFAVSLLGVHNFRVSDCSIEQIRTPEGWSNKDGVHLYGCSNGVISNIVGSTDDDFIGLSPSALDSETSFINYGDMDHIVVSNCVSNPTCTSFIGIEGASGATCKVKNLIVANCRITENTSTLIALRPSIWGAASLGYPSVENIKIQSCVLSSVPGNDNPGIYLQGSIESLEFSDCSFNIPTRNLFEHYRGSIRRLAFFGCSIDAKTFPVTLNGTTYGDVLFFNTVCNIVGGGSTSFLRANGTINNICFDNLSLNGASDQTQTLCHIPASDATKTNSVKKISFSNIYSDPNNILILLNQSPVNTVFASNIQSGRQELFRRSDTSAMLFISDFSLLGSENFSTRFSSTVGLSASGISVASGYGETSPRGCIAVEVGSSAATLLVSDGTAWHKLAADADLSALKNRVAVLEAAVSGS